MKINIEAWDVDGMEEVEVDLTATTDPVVVSCNLITLGITEGPDRAWITIPIGAADRDTPVGKALQALWDAVKKENER